MVKESILGLDKNERVIKEIKRHPIGLIEIYALAAFGLFAILGLLYFLLTNSEDNAFGNESLLVFGAVVALGLGAVGTYFAQLVYRTNELVITNENLIQILQFTIFSRQVSQLNLAKIQDVTVDQNGILASIFGFGTLQIETAGEANNFMFKLAPNPNRAAKVIIEAHEDYIKNTTQTPPRL